MKKIAPARSLFALFLLASVLASAPTASALETFLVVKTTDMDKKVDFKIMSAEEFKEQEAKIKAEATLFPKAEEMAKKEWKSSEDRKSSFPGRLNPPKIEVIERSPSQEKAGKKLDALTAAEDRRHVEPKKIAKPTEAQKKQADADAEKEKDFQAAYEMVKAKLAELVAKDQETKVKEEPKAKEPVKP